MPPCLWVGLKTQPTHPTPPKIPREREVDAQLRALRAVDERREAAPLTRRQLDALLAACARQQGGEAAGGGATVPDAAGAPVPCAAG